MNSHNPYFNRWFSAIRKNLNYQWIKGKVTILILIDGFLQFKKAILDYNNNPCHNPYFNRWFSAIVDNEKITTFDGMSQSLF